MHKKIAILLISLLSITQLTGCAITDYFKKTEKIARFATDSKVARAANIKNDAEVEITDLSAFKPSIYFTKSAIAKAKNEAQIIAQASGKVSKLNVKIGDFVNTNTVLITLGQSLSTDIAEIQYQTALQALELATTSQVFTNNTSYISTQTAALGVKTAYESYETALKAQDNAEEIYDEQYSNAKLGKNIARDAKESIEDSLDKLDDTISDLEDQQETLENTLSNLDPNDPSYEEISKSLEEIKTTLIEAKTERVILKKSLESADNGVDQADNGLDLLEVSFEAQEDQLEFAVFAAKKQHEIAANQFELALNAAELQDLGTQTQILQLNSAAQIAKLSNNQKFIKSPIKGVVTEVTATENNFIAPGQIVAKVADPTTLLIKTSINTEEAEFTTLNQSVKIIQGSKEISGKITAISPAANAYSKKINIEIEAKNTAQITLESLVKIQIPIKTNQIFIPLNSIYNGTEGQFVKTIEDNKIKYSEVSIGEIIGDFIEIRAGLRGSEKVVITPNTIVEENEIVTIKK